ncbi:MAG: GntR family transcriptional regulator [Planctomycetota bacterium]|jgi:LacI family transcriptional regulator
MSDKKNPVYSKLVEDIKAKIASSEYQAGSLLPSEAELGKVYSISRLSVRRALAELEAMNLIFKQAGKGTFVKQDNAAEKKKNAPIGFASPFPLDNSNAHLFLGPVYKAVCDTCFDLGYRVEWINHKAVDEIEKDSLSGLICASWRSADMEMLASSVDSSIPVVMINRTPQQQRLFGIKVDDREWSRRAVNYMALLGHKKIAFISSSMSQAYAQQRLNGYRDSLSGNDIEFDQELLLSLSGHNSNTVHSQMVEFCKNTDFTALFIAEGISVSAVTMSLHQLGYDIPHDVSVFTFDDVPNSFAPLIPDLNSIRMPLRQIGRQAVEMLDQFNTGQFAGERVQVLPCEMVIRDSCRSINIDSAGVAQNTAVL